MREGKRRAIGKLEASSKSARPALAQAVGDREWAEAWDRERRGTRLVSVVDEPAPRLHRVHSRRGREPTSVS